MSIDVSSGADETLHKEPHPNSNKQQQGQMERPLQWTHSHSPSHYRPASMPHSAPASFVLPDMFKGGKGTL